MTEQDTEGRRTYYTGSSSQTNNGGEANFFLFNHRGDTVAVSDKDGNIINEFSYEAYGKVTNQSGTPVNLTGETTPNLFVGAYGIRYDRKTELSYMRFRWYSAGKLRFLSADLIQNLNRFSYVEDNPIKYSDPTGLDQNTDYYWDESQGQFTSLSGLDPATGYYWDETQGQFTLDINETYYWIGGITNTSTSTMNVSSTPIPSHSPFPSIVPIIPNPVPFVIPIFFIAAASPVPYLTGLAEATLASLLAPLGIHFKVRYEGHHAAQVAFFGNNREIVRIPKWMHSYIHYEVTKEYKDVCARRRVNVLTVGEKMQVDSEYRENVIKHFRKIYSKLGTEGEYMDEALIRRLLYLKWLKENGFMFLLISLLNN